MIRNKGDIYDTTANRTHRDQADLAVNGRTFIPYIPRGESGERLIAANRKINEMRRAAEAAQDDSR